jgi:PAS domain S-box-containing protein
VVAPRLEKGKKNGFVELGEEINHITAKLKKTLGVELLVYVHKKFLHRSDWEAGMKMLGRASSWDQFPDLVLVDQTVKVYPKALTKFLSGDYHTKKITDTDIVSQNRRYRCRILEIKDVQGLSIGDMVIMTDVTTQIADLHASLKIIGFSCLILGGILFVLFSLFLGRVENQLAEAQQKLIDMEKDYTRMESEAKFYSVAQSVKDAMISSDSRGTITFWNSSAIKMFGYQEEEVIGRPLIMILPERYREIPEEERERLRSGAEPRVIGTTAELFGARKDGTEFPLEFSLTQWTAGKETFYTSLVRDITDRKKAEEALWVTQFSVDRAGESVAWIGPDGRFVYVNDESCRLLGYPREELLSLPVFAIAPLLPKERWKKYWEEIKQKGSVTIETRFRTKEAHWVPVEININSLAYQDKEYQIVFARDISERIKSQERLQRQIERLAALRAIDMAITASLDQMVTFNVILDQATSQLGVDAAEILLMDPPTQKLEYTAKRGFQTSALEYTRLSLGDGYAGRAALERRIIRIDNLKLEKNSLKRSPILEQENFLAYFGVPLIAKGQVVGVLEIFNRSPLDPDQEWLDFLEALGGQAAIAIDSATLFKNLQKSNLELVQAYDTTLEGWSKALDLRDKETEGHSQRVTEISVQIAENLGIAGFELVNIRRGALLHDIGKMGIPDSILLKAGALTEEERETMNKHPIYAYELLYPIAFLRPALDIPYCHHEKWDGTGYPRGLKGEQIPLAARIFAVADVWDALSSERPYRPAWPDEKGLVYIREQAGKHFEPRVVEVFFALLNR